MLPLIIFILFFYPPFSDSALFATVVHANFHQSFAVGSALRCSCRNGAQGALSNSFHNHPWQDRRTSLYDLRNRHVSSRQTATCRTASGDSETHTDNHFF